MIIDLFLNLDNNIDQNNKKVVMRINITWDDVAVGKKSESFERTLDIDASSAKQMLKY